MSSRSTVEKIKEKLSIADVISTYIKIDKAGINFKARCPFHNEKTPSFFVSPERGGYYCFGCGAKGDIFSFVEQFEGVDFLGALKILADRAGVSIEYSKTDTRVDKEREKLFAVLEEATIYFQNSLSQEAKDYLKKRSLTEKTIKEFRLGYAKADWRSLREYLSSRGYPDDVMLKAGLIKRSVEHNSKEPYDVFRDRIVFPILDTAGRVIAFSGRILGNDPNAPKYLNSPDSPLFNKSEVLYGLNEAKTPIRRKDYSILVEGQMDLVTCHQAGFDNTVATSGTSLTKEHIEKLKRFSNRIIMVFDGDEAGIKASERATALALEGGMEVKVGLLPEGKDPADLIGEDLEAWRKVVSSSKHVVDFYTEVILRKKLDGRSTVKEIEKKVLPFVALVSSEVEKAHFVSKLRDIMGVSEQSIWDELIKLQKNKNKKTFSAEKDLEIPKSDKVTEALSGLLYWLRKNSSPHLKYLEDKLQEILGEKFGDFGKSPENDRIIFETEQSYGGKDIGQREIDEVLDAFRKKYTDDELRKVTLKLHQAERSGDSKEVEELLKSYSVLMKKKKQT